MLSHNAYRFYIPPFIFSPIMFWCSKIVPVAYTSDVVPWVNTNGLAWHITCEGGVGGERGYVGVVAPYTVGNVVPFVWHTAGWPGCGWGWGEGWWRSVVPFVWHTAGWPGCGGVGWGEGWWRSVVPFVWHTAGWPTVAASHQEVSSTLSQHI